MSLFYAKFLAKLPLRDREKHIVPSLHYFYVSSLVDQRNISINEHVGNALVVKYENSNYLTSENLIDVFFFTGLVSI